ncbi:DNA primase [Hyphobacterium sp. CCMP332]|uniref:DNA primase n=1 Tax=Hyphobacterium sp. CCMP332 TaxID=2749086 RepID=UPI00164F7C6C|nr:DNA primase [Hyphobacterium sp. CCMP332]QNL18213.1 DNA primase [Hyphobacterium sp. CCMP332]
MRLTDDFKDEIRARVRMSDLVGRKIQLKRQGREFAGLSPFKKEKTPSFFVNDEKKFYHCFASGEHGDAFDWLMKMEGLSFMEAAEQLASIAGIPLPKADPEAAKKAEASKSLIEWMELAQRFFSRQLRSGAGADARHYLERRGYGPAEWETYEIGFAPDSRTALKDELIAAGAKPDELIDCGLLIAPDDGGAPYDRFRGRIMFAIRDPRERLVAFGGRAMSANARAKYLNSPETPIFHKGHNLYRYPQARKAAANPKSGARGLIVAEGYFDAIALARAGIEHAVAPLGTALGEDQMQLLWRAGGEPTLCFDGDNAGRMAANRAAERALPLLEPERTLRFVFLPEGKDPDDMLRDEGASALTEALGHSRPLASILWDIEAEKEPLDDPDRRAGFRKRLRALLYRIENPDVRAEYQREFDQKLEQIFGSTRRSGGRYVKKGAALGATAETKRLVETGPVPTRLRHLLLAAVEYPEIAENQTEMLSLLNCVQLNPLRDAILDALAEGHVEQTGGLRNHLAGQGFASALKRLDLEKQPMRAALGGETATVIQREEAWTRIASDYMEQTGYNKQRQEMRSRLAEEIENDDADTLRGLMEVHRRGKARRQTGQ